VTVEFVEVTEFRFMPRDPSKPFSEDDCVNCVGYWSDQADWAHGVFEAGPGTSPDPQWLMAIEFMSGAVVAVQSSSAHASIVV
jgi:hypothetical protein